MYMKLKYHENISTSHIHLVEIYSCFWTIWAQDYHAAISVLTSGAIFASYAILIQIQDTFSDGDNKTYMVPLLSIFQGEYSF